jgi:hypothetical protein
MSALPFQLSHGDHRVTCRLRRGHAPLSLEEAIARRYVHVPFSQTRGGTAWNARLDETLSRLAEAGWETGAEIVHPAGQRKSEGGAGSLCRSHRRERSEKPGRP